jgi:hypothetical protein
MAGSHSTATSPAAEACITAATTTITDGGTSIAAACAPASIATPPLPLQPQLDLVGWWVQRRLLAHLLAVVIQPLREAYVRV